MLWRRCCLDLDNLGNLIGASVELYDDSHRDANAVVVLASSELDGHCIATLAEYLAWEVGPVQLQLAVDESLERY